MANINKNPNHQAKYSRNAFDMSMIRKFTSSVGQLLPVYYDFLSPGEKVNFSTEMFTRTQPLTSPAYVKFTNHVDWFFVPMNQLYRWFGNRQFGISDMDTNLVPASVIQRDVPLASVSSIAGEINNDMTGNDSITGEPLAPAAGRLIDLLGYSVRTGLSTSQASTQKVNTLLLQAYHKIYSDVYRLSDRENSWINVYNTDDCNASDISPTILKQMLRLHHRAWKKELFTNLFPAPLINGGSTGMFSDAALQNVNDWLTPSTSTSFYNAKPTIVDNKSVSGNELSNNSSNPTTQGMTLLLRNVVSSSNLRSMFAVEKLAEITRRAPKHYDAQVLAHFGFDVPTGISGEVYRLGSDSSIFQIGEVVSTSDTLNSSGEETIGQPLGEMAGKGISYGNGKKKSFTAPCHGVLMAIYSCVPESDYQNTGMDRLNTYATREDFYQPEFDRLGMQPCFYYQRYFVGNNPTVDAQILGWQYRYAELKQKYNVCNADFGLNGTLPNWTTKRTVSPTADLSDFLIPSDYLNPIMSVNYDGTFKTDPLLHMFQFNVVKFSQMSTYGLPNL